MEKGFLHSPAMVLVRLIGVALLIVGASELLVAVDTSEKDAVAGAYLIKSGDVYVLFWRTVQDPQYRAYRFPHLGDAVRYASHLGLKRTQPPRSLVRLEHHWLRHARTMSVLHWKSSATPEPQRLTFRSRQEAEFFQDAFSSGSYTPSPFGHALFFGRR
ncbi:hypothetical protein K2X33_12405 [bacterium]|nr:hypothetical protein [bacterium]